MSSERIKAACRDLSASAADRFAGLASVETVRVGPGTVVLSPDRPAAVATLREGWAVRSRRLPDGQRHVVDIVLPGDLVGLDSLMADGVAPTVETITGATVCRAARLPADALADPAFVQALLADAVGRARRAEALLTNCCRREALGRLAWFVMHLLRRMETRGLAQGSWVPFPLRRHHVADALGLSPTHVTRTFAELHARNAAYLDGGYLSVIDREALIGLGDYADEPPLGPLRAP